MMRTKTRVKVFAVVTALLLAVLSGVGCAREAVAPAGDGAAGKVYKIGIIQLAENGAFTEMREGFLNRFGELGYAAETLEVDYKNAQGDVGTLNTICQEMAKSDKDIVVTIATPAAQAYVSQESEIPLIFISVSDPVNAGIMSAMDTPDHNATGSSNLVPVDKIFQLAAGLTPEAKNFGILYNTGEANAVSTVANAKAYFDANGYTYREATVANSSEVQQAVEALAARVDAIYVPIDSMVQSAMPQVAQIAKDAGVPVYGSSPVMVRDGALATVSTDDTQVGAASADIADKYFQGTPIADIPAVAIGDFIFVINGTTADAIGVEIPATYSDALIIE
ncbi:MAG: ABC transporter substrate-binding protein [Gracilibacteraceae bacterium]|jgi:putative ABC transport system substrate-binding protein|nr:ABC transporter substrate-binding protein [Gracilibacteraceae bacterium]